MSDDHADPALDPDDLDISTSEYVRELGEGRYVVSAGGGPPRVSESEESERPSEAASDEVRPDAAAGDETDEVDAATVGRWLAESLTAAEFAYGFDATLSIDGEATRHRTVSNDVSTTFETLVLWFARSAAGDDTPPERALAILLAEMEAEVTLPTVALEEAVERHGLTAADSIADLLAAAEREDGLTLE